MLTDSLNRSFTSVPIITLASIDFICSKEVMTRVPQLYTTFWSKPRLSRNSFVCNMLLSIVESLVILGLCFLFFPYSSACDVGMNMVCRMLSVVILDNQFVLPWLYHIHDHGHHCECPHSLHFVSPLQTSHFLYHLQHSPMVYNICGNCRVYVISRGKYRSLWNLFRSLLQLRFDVVHDLRVEQPSRDSLLCDSVCSASFCVGGDAMCILSPSFPDCERSLCSGM